jgi:hypothetical protein
MPSNPFAIEQIIAEGIEREEERPTLESLDVPLAQGFHLAMPGEPWPEVEAAALGEDEPEFSVSGPTRGGAAADR